MSFLKKVLQKNTVVAEDGPHSALPSGAADPQNHVSQLQTGKNAYEVKKDADKLNKIILDIQEHALEADHILEELMKNGGTHFEGQSPVLLKGVSSKKIHMLLNVLEKFAKEAHIA